MTKPDVERPLSRATCRAVAELLGAIDRVSLVGSGLVHHVYRVSGPHGTLIVKQRGSECAGLPGIAVLPEDITYEQSALSALAAVAPDLVPSVLNFVREDSALVLTDLPIDYSLDDVLRDGGVTPADCNRVGAALGRVHTGLATLDAESIDQRPEYYEKNLYERIGYHGEPVLDAVADRLRSQERQLVWGDPSPKNIGFGRVMSGVSFYDFEAFHCGNRVFDLGFLAGHVLLHTFARPDRAGSLLGALMDGYEHTCAASVEGDLVGQVALAIIAYRAWSPVVLYPIDLPDGDSPGDLIQRAVKLVPHCDGRWEPLARALVPQCPVALSAADSRP